MNIHHNSTRVPQVISVAVIGAGPAGIATAVELSKLGGSATIFDKYGFAGGCFQRMYRPLVLTTPKELLELLGHPIKIDARYLTASQYAGYLQEISCYYELKPVQGTVIHIHEQNDSVQLELQDGQTYSASAAVIATGMSENPIIPDFVEALNTKPGNIIHSSVWTGPSEIAGPNILIIGAGLRAVEIAEECASFGHRVFVSSRKSRVRCAPKSFFGREYRHALAKIVSTLPPHWMQAYCRRGVPLRPHDQGFKSYVSRGTVKVIGGVRSLTSSTITTVDGTKYSFDTAVLATGFRFDVPFLPDTIRAKLSTAPAPLNGKIIGTSRMFVLGFPCTYKLDSQFIQGIRRDAAFVARQIVELSNKADAKMKSSEISTAVKAVRSSVLNNSLIAVGSLLVSVLVLALTIKFYGLERDGLHQAVRYTIRFAAILFVFLLLLDKLVQYAPRNLWRYFRNHRRGLGLGFAGSICTHLTAVYLFVTSGGSLPSLPALMMDFSAATFIFLMAVTSSDFMVRALQFNRWKALHRFGLYVVWITLFLPFASRIRFDLQTYPYWIFSLLLIAAMSLRMNSHIRTNMGTRTRG